MFVFTLKYELFLLINITNVIKVPLKDRKEHVANNY